MLKPYVCVACEKVLFDQKVEDRPDSGNTASLIGLFGKIVMSVSEGIADIPSNAVIPKEWAIYSAWEPESGDEHREYILCTQLFYPDKNPFGEVSKVAVKIEKNKRYQNIVRINGFPIGQIGSYVVRTWIEENNQTVCGPLEFKIDLEINRQP
jgi:hypothetical protein